MSLISFENLKTAAGKRVRIAKDALSQIELGKLIPLRGVYLRPVDSSGVMDWNMHWKGKSGKKLLETSNCQVCALGSLLCGKLGVNGDSKVDACRPDKKLRKFFSMEQMNLIEYHFEGNWRSKYPSDKSRLVAILKNIVENRGTFIP